MTVIDTLKVPSLVFFGKLDKNVDPIQGATAYRTALMRGNHPASQVIVLPGVDHDMVPSETGCMKDRNGRRNWRVSADYLEVMYHWLIGIRNAADE